MYGIIVHGTNIVRNSATNISDYVLNDIMISKSMFSAIRKMS